ncbi:helix-turn-helix domain-containing protein [Prolixibacter denitrificans]|uniref:Transcriptional regulator n=1 Tax=Prolixibacter denitrificans TaxID=1541063 RepID=A0A2P8CAJ8_9BACT|nr:helix-turn-helix transcriptional regulator [Prolixibacter denitrificans]PSK81952.1 DNA-binding XRE family transcriptional regulator [Prolixibacter denitrificans]GET22549.1 transcriptional regulator [Prolixibacter denitrificans]
MKERINEFLLSEHLSPAEFADRIGVQRSSVSHVLNGRNNPSASFIQKMIAAFPGLSTRWLLLGEGNMTEQSTRSGSDLFTEPRQPEATTTNHEPVQKKAEGPEITQKPTHEPSVVQSEEPISYASKKEVQDIWDDGPGEIERIVVFYSDKTFKAYKPSK